jgi:hypothetical protein
VLFGATGDLAKRMVLPAFYQLDAAGLLPVEWRLVGNGRGDVSHLDFRRYVHDVLAEFGPKPDPERWTAFADNLYFAGGGFATDDPGSMLDVVADVRNGIGHDTQLVHYPAVPPSAFQPLTEALAQHDLTDKRADRLREAVRHLTGGASAVWTKPCTGSSTSRRCTGSITSWARRRRRTCTCSASRTSCSRHRGAAST